VAAVVEARAQGVDVTCETCPHYLVLTEEDMITLGAVAKCAPPLRSAQDQQVLLTALREVSTIGSDHSPSPPEMKEQENFFRVWGGISGCQHLLPLLIDLGIDRQLITELTAENVVSRFRIPGKGKLAVGCDADFSLVDLQQEEQITSESLHYRHRQSPYVGRTLRSRVVATFLRGQRIFENGNVFAEPAGRLVRPTPL
jgi:allantoinase